MKCLMTKCSENKRCICKAPKYFIQHWKLKAKWCPLHRIEEQSD